MKKVLLAGMLLMTSLGIFSQTVSRTTTGAKVDVASEKLRSEIIFYSPSIVRVVKYPYPMESMPEKKSLSVILEPQTTKISYNEDSYKFVMKTSGMMVTYNKESGALSFYDQDGNDLLREGKARFEMRTEGMDKGAYEVFQSFELDVDEAVYGLGQMQDGKMSLRGMTKRMEQGNLEDFAPLLQSVKGYGIFWDNCSPTIYSDNEDETSFDSEVGECVDYYFMYGGNADGVIAQMRKLTGEVPMFPLWTYGYWQSKERYKSQEEIVEVVKKYRELEVPLDGIIQDWQYWGSNYLWNAMEFLNEGFPNPQQMVDDIHGMNAHLIISVWSSFGPQTKPYSELSAGNMLLDFATWPQSGSGIWPPRKDYPSGVKPYDPYNPAARDIYWKYLSKLHAYGMDGWWMDSTEPDHLDAKPEDLENKTYLGSFRKVRNAYPLMSVGGVYDHQRAEANDGKRIFILTRSAFAGQQRYAANTWSGDVASTWESLRAQIPAGLNFSLTGMPHWNSDIGGFFAGHYNAEDMPGNENPMYQELYVRWLQFGAFTPMMRSHGTEVPREIYNFGGKGSPVYDAIEKTIRTRYSLLPYIYSTSWQVTKKQSTFMRALMMDFAADKNVWDINDEFMFGKSILVAPVVEAQYTPEAIVKTNEMDGWNNDKQVAGNGTSYVDFTETKTTEVYLPEGTLWYDYWTNERLQGGQTITRTTTLDLVPLFVRAGSIIPIGPDVQYATEKKWDKLVLKVYPGANGKFFLYEDEFDNYNYERGAYSVIPITWNDRTRVLTLGDRQGSYPGMLTEREFTVILPDKSTMTFQYTGKAVNVRTL